jgi:hypothetical protein
MVESNGERIGIEKSLNCVKQLTNEYRHMSSKIDWNLLAESEENAFIDLFVGVFIEAAYRVR